MRNTVIPVSVNLVTYFFSPRDRCAWPLPLFSITAGSDPSSSLSPPLYQSLCHLSLHTSGARDRHHPSAYREREGGRAKERRDIDFWCSFVKTFQIKPEVKSDWKPPETTVAPTHTHTPGTTTATQLSAPLICRFFHPAPALWHWTDTLRHQMVRLDDS